MLKKSFFFTVAKEKNKKKKNLPVALNRTVSDCLFCYWLVTLCLESTESKQGQKPDEMSISCVLLWKELSGFLLKEALLI